MTGLLPFLIVLYVAQVFLDVVEALLLLLVEVVALGVGPFALDIEASFNLTNLPHLVVVEGVEFIQDYLLLADI